MFSFGASRILLDANDWQQRAVISEMRDRAASDIELEEKSRSGSDFGFSDLLARSSMPCNVAPT